VGLVRQVRVVLGRADSAVFHLLAKESHFDEPHDEDQSDAEGGYAYRSRVRQGIRHRRLRIPGQPIKAFPRFFPG
jgi:hypothetical protein